MPKKNPLFIYVYEIYIYTHMCIQYIYIYGLIFSVGKRLVNADCRFVFDVFADNDGKISSEKSYGLVCQIHFG